MSYKNQHVRNKLEQKVQDKLALSGITGAYEAEELEYEVPASTHHYTPDFRIAPNFYIETKGIFDRDDRKKMLLVQAQYPEVTFAMVFYNATYPIYKGSNTTYADWCDEHGFPWIDIRHEQIPAEWFSIDEVSNAALP